MSSIGDRLRKIRKERKLTQKQIGDYLGMSESGYGYYEQGTRKPSNETIKKLAKKYNVSVAYLLCETDDPTPSDSDTYNPLHEIDQILKELKIKDIFFHDIEAWKNFTPEDVEELRKH